MSTWADALTQGFIPPLLDQLIKCDSLTIAHIRATCTAWRKQCSCHLNHLELTPLPVAEMEMLAHMFPNIQSITISRGRPSVRGCWFQTEHVKALATFAALSTVNLPSMTQLRPEELDQLANMDNLQSLSLPSARLDYIKQEALLNLPGLTSLTLGFERDLQHMLSQYHGGLQFLQFSPSTFDDNGNLFNISHLASVPYLALTLIIGHDGHKAVERLLLGSTNIKRVVLQTEYCEQTTTLLEALRQTSIMVELCLSTLCGLEYGERNWMSNTCVTSLRLTYVGPGLIETLACVDWLLALDFLHLQCAPTYDFSCIGHMTSLTSLRVSSKFVARTSWTFLSLLKALANCNLEAISENTDNLNYTTFMHYGSDALFCLDALTHLQVRAFFPAPDITSRSSLLNVSSNICCLEFEGPDDVSDYFMYIIAKMPCLTKLSARGKAFPSKLSFISNLRWLKELRLRGSVVSAVDLNFVCGFQYLACLQLHFFDVNDNTFLHAAMLDKLTTLDLMCCPNLTDAVFLQVKDLVSLRELRIVDCLGVSCYSAATSPSVLTCLRRLRSVTVFNDT